MSMYLVLMLFQLLCYCWHGNEVQIVSGEVSSYVFNINWIIMKESIKKSLILIMMRSQRPCYFTAGKFSLLSLQTFMTVRFIMLRTIKFITFLIFFLDCERSSIIFHVFTSNERLICSFCAFNNFCT